MRSPQKAQHTLHALTSKSPALADSQIVMEMTHVADCGAIMMVYEDVVS